MANFKIGDTVVSKVHNMSQKTVFVGDERYFMKSKGGEASYLISHMDANYSLYVPPRTCTQWLAVFEKKSTKEVDFLLTACSTKEAAMNFSISENYRVIDAIEVTWTESNG